MQSYLVLAIYGALVFVGGLMGYKKAGSMPSLIMGGISGLLLLATSYALYQGHAWAQTVAFAIPLLLTLFFLYRFSLSYAFMPAGLMIVLGIVTLLLIYFKK
jgi:uncharacterized membrane protein (UPF0136 family)